MSISLFMKITNRNDMTSNRMSSPWKSFHWLVQNQQCRFIITMKKLDIYDVVHLFLYVFQQDHVR